MNTDIPTALRITAEIAVGGTILPILIAALAGYAFAWVEFPGRDWLFIGVIALLVVPLQMALIPIFTLYNHLGLYDTVLQYHADAIALAVAIASFGWLAWQIGATRRACDPAAAPAAAPEGAAGG